jgi:hypothetical protein
MSVWSGFWIGIYCRADTCTDSIGRNLEIKIRREETKEIPSIINASILKKRAGGAQRAFRHGEVCA